MLSAIAIDPPAIAGAVGLYCVISIVFSSFVVGRFPAPIKLLSKPFASYDVSFVISDQAVRN